jgi:hypothetical protein
MNRESDTARAEAFKPTGVQATPKELGDRNSSQIASNTKDKLADPTSNSEQEKKQDEARIRDRLETAVSEKDSKKAAEIGKELLALQTELYSEKSREVGRLLQTLGDACSKDGQFGKAKDYYLRASTASEAVYGKDNFRTGLLKAAVGSMDMALSNVNDAAISFDQASSILDKVTFGTLNPEEARDAALVHGVYAKILELKGEPIEATKQRSKAQSLRLFADQAEGNFPGKL